MTLDYSTPGKARVSMLEYIDELLGEYHEDMNGRSVTPAGNSLFEVDENEEPFDETKHEAFYH